MPDDTAIVGWDIGGAHLKTALLAPSGRLTQVDQVPCPLWQGISHLDTAIRSVLDTLCDGPVAHAITMTGELADLFPDRASGVAAISDCFSRYLAGSRIHDSVNYWSGTQGFLPPSAVAQASESIASANWLATATCLAKAVGEGLLIDIGSTTTDIIPFAAHLPRPLAHTDAARLETGELVYLGIVRTPLMALADRVPVSGRWRRCMNEHFATMADVMRLCGALDESTDHFPAADNGPKSHLGSTRRLLRMVAEDTNSASPLLAGDLAHWYRSRLIDTLAVAASEVLAHAPLASDAPLVATGIGASLALELSERLCRPLCYGAGILAGEDATPEIALRASHCAPAVAVARLARSYLR